MYLLIHRHAFLCLEKLSLFWKKKFCFIWHKVWYDVSENKKPFYVGQDLHALDSTWDTFLNLKYLDYKNKLLAHEI